MENLLIYENVEISLSKEKAIALLSEINGVLKINNQSELLRVLFHFELNGENTVKSLSMIFSEVELTGEKTINIKALSEKLLIKFHVKTQDDEYSFNCTAVEMASYVQDLSFIEELMLNKIKLLELENAKKNGLIGNVKIKYAKFKESISDSSTNLDELIVKLINNEISIDAHPTQYFSDILKINQIKTENKELLLLSQYATNEFSDYLVANEDIIFNNQNEFRQIMSKSELSVQSLLELLKRRLNIFYPNTEIYTKDAFKDKLKNAFSEHTEVCDRVISGLTKITDNDSMMDVFDSPNFLPVQKMIGLILVENKLDHRYVTNLILSQSANEEISEYIIKTESFVIYDPMVIFKIDQLKSLDLKAISALSDRYEKNCSKTKQKTIALKYQNIYKNINDLSVFNDVIDSITDDLQFLFAITNQIDSSLNSEAILKSNNLETCEFDKDLIPAVSIEKLNKIAMKGLSVDSMKEDFVQFVHDLDSIEFMFKQEQILKHRNCPTMLLSSYIKQPLLYLYLLKNPKLTQSDLYFIYEQNMYDKQDYKVNDLIVKHLNCPRDLVLRISQGEVYLLNLIKTSTNGEILQSIMNQLITYPRCELAKTYKLSDRMVCVLMDEIVKNQSSDAETLDAYASYFDYLTDLTVCDLVVTHKHCRKDILNQIVDDNKNEYVEKVVKTDKIDEELANKILAKKLNSIIYQSKNMHSVEFLNHGVDAISRKLLADKKEICADFIKNFKKELLNSKKISENNFFQYLVDYLKHNNYAVYGGLIPISAADLT